MLLISNTRGEIQRVAFPQLAMCPAPLCPNMQIATMELSRTETRFGLLNFENSGKYWPH